MVAEYRMKKRKDDTVSEALVKDLAALRPTNITLARLLYTGLTHQSKPSRAYAQAMSGLSADDAPSPAPWEEDPLPHHARAPAVATDEALIEAAGFLLEELPRRYAHRMRELDGLPPQLQAEEGCIECREQFRASIGEVLRFRDSGGVRTLDDERAFAQMVKRNMDRHGKTLVLMASALFGYQQKMGLEMKEMADDAQLHSRLDSFQLGRIGTRVICGQYLELHRGWEGAGTRSAAAGSNNPAAPPGTPGSQNSFVGLINPHSSPAQTARFAIADAAKLCEREFGAAPEVRIEGDIDRVFPYIPSHLYYMLFELLKNSMRATLLTHRGYCDTDGTCSFMPYLVPLPAVELTIGHSEKNQDVVMKISDKGGGISRDVSKRLFSYLFTTARPDTIATSAELLDYGQRAPMAGLGYGLPISRTYARYFGGEVTVISVEGVSTDAYLHLNKLGDANEPLPYFWEGARDSGGWEAMSSVTEPCGSSVADPGSIKSVDYL